MCFPAKAEQAQSFAEELQRRMARDVQTVRVVRTGLANPWFPDTDVEVHVVAAGDPEELRPKVADMVTEYMWRDDVWVEVRVVESTAEQREAPRERLVIRA